MEQAKDLWKKFDEKFLNLSEGISKERAFYYSEKINLDEVIDRELQRRLGKEKFNRIKATDVARLQKLREATKSKLKEKEQNIQEIQTKWREKIRQDTLIGVNPKGNHRGIFKNFVNLESQNAKHSTGVKKSLNQEKLSILLNAIKKGDWDNEVKIGAVSYKVFDDETLPQLALSLFDSNKITQQQFFTILERHQTLKTSGNYNLISTLQILDDDGEFTEEAQRYLLPEILHRKKNIKNLTKEQLEDFRLLVATRPKSEQTFYVTTLGDLRSTAIDDVLVNNLEASFVNKFHKIFHLSCGARDALSLARFGIDEYVRSVPRLHMQTMADIEEGSTHAHRYAAIYFPGTISYTKIHAAENPSGVVARIHDIYHANSMSFIPKCFLSGLNKIKDEMREVTGFTWSKEIWLLVDAELHHVFRQITVDQNNLKQMTELFCKMINPPNEKKVIFYRHGSSISIARTVLILDMLKSHDDWKTEFKVDPDQLIEPLSGHYLGIKKIYDKIKNDDPKIQLFKCHLYQWLSDHGREDIFEKLNKIINDNHTEIGKKINFQKITKDIEKDSPLYPLYKESYNASTSRYESLSTIHLCFDANPINKNVLSELLKLDKICKLNNEQAIYYGSSVIDLKYNEEQALKYVKFREVMSDFGAQFRAKPTTRNWLKANLAITIFSCMTIIGIIPIVLYANAQANQEKSNPSPSPLKQQDESKPAERIIGTDISINRAMPKIERTPLKEIVPGEANKLNAYEALIQPYRFQFSKSKNTIKKEPAETSKMKSTGTDLINKK